MGRYKKLNVGDTVFAVTPYGKLISAKIKTINPEDDLPYELDIEARTRFYPRADLYLTKEAAQAAIRRDAVKGMEQALKDCKSGHLDMKSDYDPKTHTFTDVNGERISEYFQLSDEEKSELSKLASKLSEFCHKHTIPLIALACVAHQKKGDYFMTSSILPGPRAPEFFWDIEDELHNMGMD